MRPYSHINITLVGFGNVGRCILNVLLQEHHRRFRINIVDPSNNVSGSMMDLGHTSMLTKRHQIHWNDDQLFNYSDFIFYSAGISIPLNQNRAYALDQNLEMVKSVFARFKPAKNPIIITISNPVDVVALEILKQTKLSNDNVIGIGTILETLRLTYQFSLVTGIDASEIETLVVGEHGETSVPLISNTFIRNIPVRRLLSDGLIADCIYETRRAAHRIKETQGASFYAASNAAVTAFQRLLEPQSEVMPLSIYHPSEEIFYSAPVQISNGQYIPLILSLDTIELEALESSKEKIRMMSWPRGLGNIA